MPGQEGAHTVVDDALEAGLAPPPPIGPASGDGKAQESALAAVDVVKVEAGGAAGGGDGGGKEHTVLPEEEAPTPVSYFSLYR